MTTSARTPSIFGRLVRAGFFDATRGQSLCADKDLTAIFGPVDAEHPLLRALGHSPDPDLALLTLVRLCAQLRDTNDQTRIAALTSLLQETDPLVALTDKDNDRALSVQRVFKVLGLSTALCDDLVRRPDRLDVLLAPQRTLELQAPDMRSLLLNRVGADSGASSPRASLEQSEATTALRAGYRELLLQIAAYDLSAPDPTSVLGEVSAALADLAAAALEAALAIARSLHSDHGQAARLAVIGMGKCGGQELNYISDVDVIYVTEPAPGFSQDEGLKVGTRLAKDLALICSGPGLEPPLWPVDAALRPEGKQGPLVRTIESHVAYYQRWAQTWEFQALLKARLVAGDAEVGARYLEAVDTFVWSAAGRKDFVSDSQAMRRRVEENVPAKEAPRQLKLGKGGLRDIEFTVQLLQLVHGRHDSTIHSANTLTALEQLSAGGYVGREHVLDLAQCYRFLRTLEHRLQLRHLRRTHLIPTDPVELEVLARSVAMRKEGARGLDDKWHGVRRKVRKLHQALFYRPLLPATARLSPEEASLAPAAAQARLAAIGYRDPAGSMRHIEALTEGLSRRAAIQRQLLPVMLGWFSQGADPDQGLLNFRTLSEDLGSTHWYLKLLRDSGSAAKRLAFLLSTSKYVSAALSRSPESIAWLDKEEDLEILDRARLETECFALVSRAESPAAGATLVRALRRRELARISCAQMLYNLQPAAIAVGITDAAEVALAGTAQLAHDLVLKATPNGVPAVFAVIAMGRMGGREMGYGSDADVMFVYETANGATDKDAAAYAHQVAVQLRTLLTEGSQEPALPIDADLRPEGRTGPLVRSLASYTQYYARWSAPWESQALLRARAIAGDQGLSERFIELIDPLRYPAQGLDSTNVKEIRRLKARMESERLPRGADPSRHLKLGRGSITDVEWVVQLLQLQHGHRVLPLRTTETLAGLEAATNAGLIGVKDANTLAQAWQLASNLRDANVLWTGRTTGAHVDVLPTDRVALGAIGRVLGYPQGSASQVEEDYLRKARLARKVMERLFYEPGT